MSNAEFKESLKELDKDGLERVCILLYSKLKTAVVLAEGAADTISYSLDCLEDEIDSLSGKE